MYQIGTSEILAWSFVNPCFRIGFDPMYKYIDCLEIHRDLTRFIPLLVIVILLLSAKFFIYHVR